MHIFNHHFKVLKRWLNNGSFTLSWRAQEKKCRSPQKFAKIGDQSLKFKLLGSVLFKLLLFFLNPCYQKWFFLRVLECIFPLNDIFQLQVLENSYIFLKEFYKSS